MTVTLADAMYAEGQDVYVPVLSTYEDLVRVSRAVMKVTDQTAIGMLHQLQQQCYLLGVHCHAPKPTAGGHAIRNCARSPAQGRTPEAQAELVRRCMRKLWSERAADMFRIVAKPSQWSAEVGGSASGRRAAGCAHH
jgi:hypothetical protein